MADMYEKRIGVIAGYKEVYGTSGFNYDQLIIELQKYDQQNISNFLSTLTLLAVHQETRSGGIAAQLSLIGSLIEKDRAKAEKYVEDVPDSNVLFIQDLVILALQKLNYIHNRPGGLTLDNPINKHSFAKIILSMNSLWTDGKMLVPHGREGTRPDLNSSRNKGTKETIRVLQAVQELTIGNVPIKNLLIRGDYFLEMIRQEKYERLNFQDRFERVTGISIDHYIDMVFMLNVGWTVVDFDKISENIFKQFSYFENANIPQNEIDNFISLSSFNPVDFSDMVSQLSEKANVKPESIYNHIGFLKTPIQNFEDKLICINPYFLSKLLTEGAYNIVREDLKGSGRENDLPLYWGEIYENYVIENLTSAFEGKLKTNITNPDGTKSIDCVLELDDVVLAIEIKYPHWSFESRVTGRRDAMRDFILRFCRYKPYRDRPGGKIKKSKKGFGQIKQFLENYLSGKYQGVYDFKGKAMIPVVVLGEEYPIDPFNIELIHNHLDAQGCMIRSVGIGQGVILTTEDIELLLSLKEGENREIASELLRDYCVLVDQKSKSPYMERPTSFKNHVLLTGFRVSDNSMMGSRFDSIIDRLRAKLRTEV